MGPRDRELLQVLAAYHPGRPGVWARVALRLASGDTTSEAARACEVPQQTASRVGHRWREAGTDALIARRRGPWDPGDGYRYHHDFFTVTALWRSARLGTVVLLTPEGPYPRRLLHPELEVALNERALDARPRDWRSFVHDLAAPARRWPLRSVLITGGRDGTAMRSLQQWWPGPPTDTFRALGYDGRWQPAGPHLPDRLPQVLHLEYWYLSMAATAWGYFSPIPVLERLKRLLDDLPEDRTVAWIWPNDRSHLARRFHGRPGSPPASPIQGRAQRSSSGTGHYGAASQGRAPWGSRGRSLSSAVHWANQHAVKQPFSIDDALQIARGRGYVGERGAFVQRLRARRSPDRVLEDMGRYAGHNWAGGRSIFEMAPVTQWKPITTVLGSPKKGWQVGWFEHPDREPPVDPAATPTAVPQVCYRAAPSTFRPSILTKAALSPYFWEGFRQAVAAEYEMWKDDPAEYDESLEW